ncbi:MAG: coproporphyrinogen dehydrogenase HemZ [Clostridia bacterium]|nr:coproporphyrinogen dehydrogenase HemZ [Clostridia bacterium]
MIITNFPKIENDLNDVIRSFSLKVEDITATHQFVEDEKGLFIRVLFEDKEYVKRFLKTDYKDEIEKIRLIKRYSKILLYNALKERFNVNHPWGSLTGIRPVKLYKQLTEREKVDAYDYFNNVYDVSQEKCDLAKQIYDVQKPLYDNTGRGINLYIGIPFCVSRCYYCSFISQDLRFSKPEIVDIYLDALIKDVLCAKQLLNAKNYNLRSVYIGGGTPTSLNESQLERLLSVCDFDVPEFTVEAGRPDTITEKKLELISKVANRISVNPQTAKDQTLSKIGRNHTFKDFLNCYEMANKYDFEINCDLIAGLMDEDANDFENSVKEIISLNPENITLHTLSLKAGSKLKESTSTNQNDNVFEMMQRGYKNLFENGYKPYYLYRQKYMAGNLENTGFYKKSPCIYNIDIMEENTSIIACGANAISKKFYNEENRLERFAYPKDVMTYVQKIDKNLEERAKLFE